MRRVAAKTCRVPVNVPVMLGPYSIADLAVTVTVFRNDDLIEVDESEIYVDGRLLNRGASDKRVLIDPHGSQADRTVHDAVMAEINNVRYGAVFDKALAEAEQSDAEDRGDDAHQERCERRLEAAE